MKIKQGDIFLRGLDKTIYVIDCTKDRIAYLTQLAGSDGSVIQTRPYFKSTVKLYFTKLTI